MVVSMALAALMLSFGFFFVASFFAAEVDNSRKGFGWLLLAWAAAGTASLGFAFIAGSLWQ